MARVEYMIAHNLCEKFIELGFVFQKPNSGTRVYDHTNDIYFEVDVMLENSDKVMLAEVKTKLTIEDVKDHIARIEKMRKYADLHGDKRVFRGGCGSCYDIQCKREEEYLTWRTRRRREDGFRSDAKFHLHKKYDRLKNTVFDISLKSGFMILRYISRT
jgi:hypothetical protein